jgi:CRP-like cAMP-binding protein
VDLADRQELERPNQPIKAIYFIEAGIAAVISHSGVVQIGVGLVGCEGVTGIATFLGDNQSPHLTTMITAGQAYRADIDALHDALDADRGLKRLLLRYALAFYNQAAHTALANAASSLEQRVYRWLLMANDRFAGDIVPITHDQISFLIHARRPGVTTALKSLEMRGIIARGRGEIRILQRETLEAAAGSFYGRPESEFARLIGTPWPPVP